MIRFLRLRLVCLLLVIFGRLLCNFFLCSVAFRTSSSSFFLLLSSSFSFFAKTHLVHVMMRNIEYLQFDDNKIINLHNINYILHMRASRARQHPTTRKMCSARATDRKKITGCYFWVRNHKTRISSEQNEKELPKSATGLHVKTQQTKNMTYE